MIMITPLETLVFRTTALLASQHSRVHTDPNPGRPSAAFDCLIRIGSLHALRIRYNLPRLCLCILAALGNGCCTGDGTG